MGKKILAMCLVVVMVLGFAACAKEPSVQEIVDNVIETWSGVKTYQFDMDMTMDMAGEADGEAVAANITMDSSGALDVENSQMMMDMTMNIAMPEEDEMEMTMAMYLVDNMTYMMMEMPLTGPMWVKMEVPEEYREEINLTESQVGLLKEAAEVKLISSEKVEGVDCYVLEVTPDMKKLWEMVMQQAQVGGQQIVPDVAEESLSEIFRSFSVKYWVAKDTYFLTKTDIDMVLELTPEAMGLPEEEGTLTMDIAIIMLPHSYNQPVSIVLPPEAEEAIEIPGGSIK